MLKRLSLVFLFALIAALPATAWAQKGKIKIAVQAPLSGEQAAFGEHIKLGAQLAVEESVKAFKALGYDLGLGAPRRPGQTGSRRRQRAQHRRRPRCAGYSRPLQLRRRAALIGSLQRRHAGDDLAGEHRDRDHRPRLSQCQSRLRPRRRPRSGRRALRRARFEAQIGLHHSRQDALRPGRGGKLPQRSEEARHERLGL